jgi:hypothetical protein
MAIIPMKQNVTISPFTGVDEDYGTPAYGENYDVKCRFQESVKLVRNQHGNEVVSIGIFFFDRLAAISINDLLTHTNELGAETTYSLLSISVRRDIGGKPLLTEVHV